VQEVYQRRHANGARSTVALDTLGLGYEVSVWATGARAGRIGSWWRLEDATRAADTAAHPHGCGHGCERWQRCGDARRPPPSPEPAAVRTVGMPMLHGRV